MVLKPSPEPLSRANYITSKEETIYENNSIKIQISDEMIASIGKLLLASSQAEQMMVLGSDTFRVSACLNPRNA
jgi:hypothetical protein